MKFNRRIGVLIALVSVLLVTMAPDSMAGIRYYWQL
jgi:hypothetical protein